MLSHKSKYALKALLVLTEEYGKDALLISDIAEREKIPKRFLELILLELKNHGILRSKKGKGGGYALARPAQEINVGQIVRVLDGPLAPIQCASVTAYRPCDDCGDEKACTVRLIMVKARNAIAAVLDSHTLADMRALGDPAEAMAMFHI